MYKHSGEAQPPNLRLDTRATALTSMPKPHKKNANKGPYQNTIGRMMNSARNPIATRRTVLSIQGFISSTAGGVLAGAFSMDPSGSAEWASFALIYDQFRVIGGQLHVSSTVPNSAITSGLVRFAFDNDSATTPASYADVMAYSEITDIPAMWSSGSVRTINFKRPVVRGIPQTGSIWYNETSPSSSPGSLKFYGQGFTASTLYWNYVLDYLVEFQMRS